MDSFKVCSDKVQQIICLSNGYVINKNIKRSAWDTKTMNDFSFESYLGTHCVLFVSYPATQREIHTLAY